MANIPETELKQRISDLVHFVRDFAANNEKDRKIVDKRDGYQLTIIDKDVILDFGL